MIGHQAIGMTAPSISLHHDFKKFEKDAAILIIHIDCLSGIPASGQVVHGPRVFEAQGASHTQMVTRRNWFGRCEVIFAQKESERQLPAKVALRIFPHRALGEIQGWELTVQQLAGGSTRETEDELERFRCLKSAEE